MHRGRGLAKLEDGLVFAAPVELPLVARPTVGKRCSDRTGIEPNRAIALVPITSRAPSRTVPAGFCYKSLTQTAYFILCMFSQFAILNRFFSLLRCCAVGLPTERENTFTP